MAARQSPRAVALSLFRVAIMAGSMISMKVGVRSCPPLMLTTLRFLFAAITAYAIARIAGAGWPPSRSDWTRTIVLAVLQVCLPTTLLCASMKYSSAGTASIVYATQPLALAVLASRFLGERLTKLKAMGLLLGFGGVVFVMLARVGAGGKTDSPIGIILNGTAVLCLTASTLFFKKFPPRGSPFMSIAIQYAAGAFVLVPMVIGWERPWGHVHFNVSVVESLLYLVVFSSVVGQLVWQVMLAKGEASVFTSYFFLTPIFGIALATLFLKEKFSNRDAVGMVVAVAGIILIARAPAAKPLPKPAVK